MVHRVTYTVHDKRAKNMLTAHQEKILTPLGQYVVVGVPEGRILLLPDGCIARAKAYSPFRKPAYDF